MREARVLAPVTITGGPVTADRRGAWRNFDWLLLVVMLVLIGIGILMIYSSYEVSFAGKERSFLDNAVYRQSLFAGIGLLCYFVLAALDYRVFINLSRWLYAFVLVTLGVIALLGSTSFGAQSWLDILTFGIQPSELAKVLMILVLARQLGASRRRLQSPMPLFISIALLVPPLVLIYLQPDFGMAAVLAAVWLGMVFLSGVRWQHLLLLALLAAIVAPLIWFEMDDYMRDRIITFAFPDSGPSDSSYNITQALISIGSGGIWGKGLLNGTQSQLHFLRVRHTDFIFCVWAEEFGFVGAIFMLALFAILVARMIRIALQAPDHYGRVMVAGAVTMILVQAVVNLGMNANILPVTGLTLPLVSYGGSSLVSTMMALGLTQSVSMRQRSTEARFEDALD
jgi:rod shape determining protein RodA